MASLIGSISLVIEIASAEEVLGRPVPPVALVAALLAAPVTALVAALVALSEPPALPVLPGLSGVPTDAGRSTGIRAGALVVPAVALVVPAVAVVVVATGVRAEPGADALAGPPVPRAIPGTDGEITAEAGTTNDVGTGPAGIWGSALGGTEPGTRARPPAIGWPARGLAAGGFGTACFGVPCFGVPCFGATGLGIPGLPAAVLGTPGLDSGGGAAAAFAAVLAAVTEIGGGPPATCPRPRPVVGAAGRTRGGSTR
ncbi:MAG TPA: hypothetical protein VF444_23590, partial [Pseudonocardiaceae bacterium]